MLFRSETATSQKHVLEADTLRCVRRNRTYYAKRGILAFVRCQVLIHLDVSQKLYLLDELTPRQDIGGKNLHILCC